MRAFHSPSAKRVPSERTSHPAHHPQEAAPGNTGPHLADDSSASERTRALIEGLLRVAEDADRLSDEAAKIDQIPLPIRASVADRVAQLSYFVRLLARQLDIHGEKSTNVQVDG